MTLSATAADTEAKLLRKQQEGESVERGNKGLLDRLFWRGSG